MSWLQENKIFLCVCSITHSPTSCSIGTLLANSQGICILVTNSYLKTMSKEYKFYLFHGYVCCFKSVFHIICFVIFHIIIFTESCLCIDLKPFSRIQVTLNFFSPSPSLFLEPKPSMKIFSQKKCLCY